ncbi:MAG: Osmolarity sensor protein EnvZ [Alphaproteobacteria bacterium MarineAlpha6_Bin3]|nr:MAG: Osmolarity sensor protein EnvZ [Alphaproteobacteria bacterium MarineAlpha6_Bin3]|tara:strand:+ start:1067 stop:2359 length:1293 start_codon:yes stop_codon:yes gene_type:complete
MIKKFLPQTLLGRSILILVVPLIILQIIITIIFYDRHWDTITRHRTIDFVNDITLIIESIEKNNSEENLEWTLNNVSKKLQLQTVYKRNAELKFDENKKNKTKLRKTLLRNLDPLGKNFYLNINDKKKLITVMVQMNGGVLEFQANKKRIYSSTTYIFILWMIGASIILFIVALLFLKNQIKPIRKLAIAVDRFGKGREIKNFKPSGAKEVRRVSNAFKTMKERIENSISQRNKMFSSISHDIRTILTRMKLNLELQKLNKGGLKKDLIEMEEMVEEYLNYAKGEKEEKIKKINIVKLLNLIKKRYLKKNIYFNNKQKINVMIRTNSIKRCIHNLLSNSLKFSKKIKITCKKRNNFVEIIIDDDGPGIPKKERNKVLQPFYRVEGSRNRDTGGIGLGITIAADIITSHRGNFLLEDSPLGGLRAKIYLPI